MQMLKAKKNVKTVLSIQNGSK